jgi:UDP-N-acetylmuramyl pentapeptide phosphotransferase/UDP-N-acetylglucosamine-1-phosphate transferase
MPLLAETLLLVLIFYLLGIGIGFLLFGRRPRRNYLGDE